MLLNGKQFYLAGKSLRLQQQYFWCAASLSDIMRRFKNTGQPITEFSNRTSTTTLGRLRLTQLLFDST
jgi:glucan phosphorylase